VKSCFKQCLCVVAFALATNSTSHSIADEPAPTRRLLLDGLESTTLNVAGWQVQDFVVTKSDSVAPKLGQAAILIAGAAKTVGGKIDASLASPWLDQFEAISLWVDASQCRNVSRVGLQIHDAEGEILTFTVPLTSSQWQEIVWDRTSSFQQAYPQTDRNSKVDFPVKEIHAIAFSQNAGPMQLVIDALTAKVARQTGGRSVQCHPIGDTVLDAGAPTLATFVAENTTTAAVELKVDWSLQLNGRMIEALPPDPTLGYDHAVGVKTKVTVDGRDYGDSRLTDDSEYTAFETPWAKGYREAIVDVDLDHPRLIRSLQWQAADANWIWFTDLSTSIDGTTFTPVKSVQHFEMHKKWGRNSFPLPTVIDARYLRFRFYKDNETTNVIRLPSTLLVFDGIENDHVTIPTPGQTLATGTASCSIAAGDLASLNLTQSEPLKPGSYLLVWTESSGNTRRTSWEQILIKPADAVVMAKTKRFGINASTPRYADSMADCGFGWVRFENGKWQMFCDAPNHFGFDGSIPPWHVNQDEIYDGYQRHGMSVLPYVFQTPEWATSAGADIKQNRAGYPPKNNSDYREAVFQMVARYGTRKVDSDLLRTSDKKSGLNRIQAIELWNEPNLDGPAWAPFVGPLDQYFEVMRAGVEGSRRADPDLPVSCAGWAGTHLSIVDKMARYQYADGKRPIDLIDIINVHFYSGRDNPEVCRTDPNLRQKDDVSKDLAFPEQLQELIQWRNQHNSKAQIWLTETGNDVGGPIGLSERQQAAKLPRVMMIAIASGIDKVFIYRESGSDPSMHAGAGLLRNDGSVRPSWITTATVIRQLQGFEGKAIRLPHADPNVWLLAWHDDQRFIVAAWTIGTPVKIDSLFEQKDVIGMVDAFGHSIAGQPEPTTIELSEFPCYVHLRRESPTARKILDAR